MEDDCKNLEDLEESPESKFKKVFVIVIGIFLVLLMISYIVVDYPIGNIIRGQVESNPLEGSVIDVGDFLIIFENGIEKIVQGYYTNEQKVEFSLCLSGRKYNDYYIDEIYQPRQLQQSFNHVSFEPCSSDTLILLHTHPYKSCLASVTDLNTLEKMRQENEHVLMVVMCEPGRFSVY